MVTGHEFKYELSSKPYDNWMTENEGVFSLSRFLTISHSKDKEGLWQSHIDIESLKFKPSVIDLFSSSIGTNKYFSPSRIRTFEIHIASFSMALFYWLKNEKLINEFKKMFTFVIESIFELLDYNVEFENLSEDIEAIVQILSDKAEEKSSGIYLHMKAMFIISFLEKILRLVYSALDEKIFFEKNIT